MFRRLRLVRTGEILSSLPRALMEDKLLLLDGLDCAAIIVDCGLLREMEKREIRHWYSCGVCENSVMF
jgi:hypothetical protein